MASSLLINIDVPDLSRATQFYVEAFGLQVGRIFGAEGIELLGLSSPIYLLQKKDGSLPFKDAPFPRTFARHWTPVHLDIVVDEIEAAVLKAKIAGAELEQPIQTAKWGKMAMMADPFGNGFCVVQFVGKGYDEITESD